MLNYYCLFYYIIFFFTSGVSSEESLLCHEGLYFENAWSVRIAAGPKVAHEIAQKEKFNIIHGPENENLYVFHKNDYPRKSKHPGRVLTNALKKYEDISWLKQHVAFDLKSRDFSRKRKMKFINKSCPRAESPDIVSHYASVANDKMFLNQWYMQECRTADNEMQTDINVVPVWKKHKLFGRGKVIVIIDDGILITHKDLADNYDPEFGLDLQDNDNIPIPKPCGFQNFAHGTRCAGVIAMKANNKMCGVGIAPAATIGGVRLLGPKPSNDEKNSKALSFKCQQVDIYSNSWGPNDDGVCMPKIGDRTASALKNGATHGSDGKGSIYIFAAGNGKMAGDNCGADPYVSSIYTIAVASCDQNGLITEYSEKCASVMVTTYSGDNTTPFNVVTTDVGGTGDGDSCTDEHNGTSASAPMVSAAISLAKGANSKLTRRAIEHGIVISSQVAPLIHNEKTWYENAAKILYSHDFGFGMLNVEKLVDYALEIEEDDIGPPTTCVIEHTSKGSLLNGGVEFNVDRPLQIRFKSTGCANKPSQVRSLEHVQVVVDLKYPRRGDLQISLISPSGMEALLLQPRKLDSNPYGLKDWSFDSVATWAENPEGEWKLIISLSKGASKNNVGRLDNFAVIFHGTAEPPIIYETSKEYYEYT